MGGGFFFGKAEKFWGGGRFFSGPTDLKFLLGNPLCGLGSTLRVGNIFSVVLLLSPVKEVSKKPAPSSDAGGTAQGACGPLEKPRGSSVVRPEIASFLLRNTFGRVFRPRRRKARPRPPRFVRRLAPASRRLMTGLFLFPSGCKSSRAAALAKAVCFRERTRPNQAAAGRHKPQQDGGGGSRSGKQGFPRHSRTAGACRPGQVRLRQAVPSPLARPRSLIVRPLPPLSGSLPCPAASVKNVPRGTFTGGFPNTTQTQARRKVFSRYFRGFPVRLKVSPKHFMGVQAPQALSQTSQKGMTAT